MSEFDYNADYPCDEDKDTCGVSVASVFDFIGFPYKITKPIRLIELFAGIGAQSSALERIGANYEPWRVIENDKYALESYNAVHGTNFELQDIKDVKGKDLGIVDTDKYEYLLTYSFPCVDLSLSGRRKGADEGSGTRSSLLWEVKRLLNECKELPQVLMLENVPQVHSTENRANFEKWCDFLESKGYRSYWCDLNARDFGVPQNRLRCYMISFLGEGSYKFPEGRPLEKTMLDCLEENVPEEFYITNDSAWKMIDKLVQEGKMPIGNKVRKALPTADDLEEDDW